MAQCHPSNEVRLAGWRLVHARFSGAEAEFLSQAFNQPTETARFRELQLESISGIGYRSGIGKLVDASGGPPETG